MSRRHTATAAAAVLALLGGIAICQPSYAEHREVRIYDRYHHDYHTWNKNEDRAYRSYHAGRHVQYREYHRLNRHQQQGYWTWRHAHPDD